MTIMESVYGGINMTRQFKHLGSGGVPTGRVYKMNTVVYGLRNVIDEEDIDTEGLLTKYFYDFLNR